MTQQALFALVVVYNRSCAESSVCRALLEARDIVVPVIFDNGDRDFGNREWCERYGWHFIGGRGNLGLPKAYNEGIEYCQEQDPDGTICMLDDDAMVTREYFEKLVSVVQGDAKSDIFVPIYQDSDGILSPCLLKRNGSCRFFRDASEAHFYRGNALTAVNSGMAARIRVFDDYRYDERLFLDFVDHSFFRDMNGLGKHIRIFEGGSWHSFSSREHPPVESAVRRFEIFTRDVRIFWEHHPLNRFRLIFRRTVRLTVEYRSILFLRTLVAARRSGSVIQKTTKGVKG